MGLELAATKDGIISVSILFNEQADQAIDIRKFWCNLVRINNYRQKNDLELNPKSKNEIVSLLKCIPPFLISFSNFQSAKKTFDESEAPKPKPANQKRKNKRNKKK